MQRPTLAHLPTCRGCLAHCASRTLNAPPPAGGASRASPAASRATRGGGSRRVIVLPTLALGVLAISTSSVLIRLADAPGLAIGAWRLTLAFLVLSPLGAPALRRDSRPEQFIAPHGLAVDSRGDIYVGEVSWSFLGRYLDPPREFRCFRKLIRVP